MAYQISPMTFCEVTYDTDWYDDDRHVTPYRYSLMRNDADSDSDTVSLTLPSYSYYEYLRSLYDCRSTVSTSRIPPVSLVNIPSYSYYEYLRSLYDCRSTVSTSRIPPVSLVNIPSYSYYEYLRSLYDCRSTISTSRIPQGYRSATALAFNDDMGRSKTWHSFGRDDQSELSRQAIRSEPTKIRPTYPFPSLHLIQQGDSGDEVEEELMVTDRSKNKLVWVDALNKWVPETKLHPRPYMSFIGNAPVIEKQTKLPKELYMSGDGDARFGAMAGLEPRTCDRFMAHMGHGVSLSTSRSEPAVLERNNEKREAARRRAQELAELRRQRKAYSTPLYTPLTERLKHKAQSTRVPNSTPVSPHQPTTDRAPSPRQVWNGQAGDKRRSRGRTETTATQSQPLKREISINLNVPRKPEDGVEGDGDGANILDGHDKSDKRVSFREADGANDDQDPSSKLTEDSSQNGVKSTPNDTKSSEQHLLKSLNRQRQQQSRQQQLKQQQQKREKEKQQQQQQKKLQQEQAEKEKEEEAKRLEEERLEKLKNAEKQPLVENPENHENYYENTMEASGQLVSQKGKDSQKLKQSSSSSDRYETNVKNQKNSMQNEIVNSNMTKSTKKSFRPKFEGKKPSYTNNNNTSLNLDKNNNNINNSNNSEIKSSRSDIKSSRSETKSSRAASKTRDTGNKVSNVRKNGKNVKHDRAIKGEKSFIETPAEPETAINVNADKKEKTVVIDDNVKMIEELEASQHVVVEVEEDKERQMKASLLQAARRRKPKPPEPPKPVRQKPTRPEKPQKKKKFVEQRAKPDVVPQREHTTVETVKPEPVKPDKNIKPKQFKPPTVKKVKEIIPEPPRPKPMLAGMGQPEKPKPSPKTKEVKLPITHPSELLDETEEDKVEDTVVERRPVVKKERRDNRRPIRKEEPQNKLPALDIESKPIDSWIYESEDYSEEKTGIRSPTETLPSLHSADLNPEFIEKAKESKDKEKRRKQVLAQFLNVENSGKRWRKPGRDSSYQDELRRLELAEARRKKQQEMYDRLKNRKMSNMNDTDDAPNFADWSSDYDGFLSKYCIFTRGNMEMYRHAYDAVDENRVGWLDGQDTMIALRGVNNKLSEMEEEYLYRVLELTGYKITNGSDFKVFSVLAALSQRITALDNWMKNVIGNMDFKQLERKLWKCKTLWECNVDEDTNTISLDQLCVELRAGGVSYEHELEVRDKLRHLHSLDLLDFLTYVPLFILIHESVVENPLDDTRQK